MAWLQCREIYHLPLLLLPLLRSVQFEWPSSNSLLPIYIPNESKSVSRQQLEREENEYIRTPLPFRKTLLQKKSAIYV